MNTNQAIKGLLSPNSIAIVGASNNQKKHGGRIIQYLRQHRYAGKIYPINPKEQMIQGLTSYQTMDDIHEPIDLACLLIAPPFLLETLASCARKQIKTVMIHAAGFAETGEDGKQMQEKIVRFARQNGIRICGPNTIGIANVQDRVFASFSMSMSSENVPESGTISYITQSGAIGGGMLSQGWEKRLGINKWISSGNEADLDSADYINYLVEDDGTRTICVFLEGVNDGEKFKQALTRAAQKKKPVIIYKNGRSDVGERSIRSHTGVLAGDYATYQAVFKQFGVVAARDLDDLFDFAVALDSLSLPVGNRVGVVSTSGGACTIVADSCIEHGLEVPDLSPSGKHKLKAILPDFGTPQNPFDTTAQILNDPTSFKRGLEVFIEDDHIDAMVLMLTTLAGPLGSQVADDIIKLSRVTEKPMLVAWTIAESLASEGMKKLREAKIPLYSSAERAVRSLKAMARYRDFINEWEKKKHVYIDCLLKEGSGNGDLFAYRKP
jgi:acyl-CoA synthetase (NDP forming)